MNKKCLTIELMIDEYNYTISFLEDDFDKHSDEIISMFYKMKSQFYKTYLKDNRCRFKVIFERIDEDFTTLNKTELTVFHDDYIEIMIEKFYSIMEEIKRFI